MPAAIKNSGVIGWSGELAAEVSLQSLNEYKVFDDGGALSCGETMGLDGRGDVSGKMEV